MDRTVEMLDRKSIPSLIIFCLRKLFLSLWTPDELLKVAGVNPSANPHFVFFPENS